MPRTHRMDEIKALSKAMKTCKIQQGFISTNFGWLHEKWIESGVAMQAITPTFTESADGSRSYSILSTGESYDEIDKKLGITKTKMVYDFNSFTAWDNQITELKAVTLVKFPEWLEFRLKLLYPHIVNPVQVAAPSLFS